MARQALDDETIPRVAGVVAADINVGFADPGGRAPNQQMLRMGRSAALRDPTVDLQGVGRIQEAHADVPRRVERSGRGQGLSGHVSCDQGYGGRDGSSRHLNSLSSIGPCDTAAGTLVYTRRG